MAATSRILMLLFIIVSLLPEAASAGPKEAPPAEGRELEVARDLLHQAKRLLDSQYRASPTGGFRYTAGVAASLAEVGDHDAAEATLSHLRSGDRDVPLRALAIGYARGGDLARVRQTIARIRDANPNYARQKPLAWREAGRALAKSGHKGAAAEAFAEAVRCIPGRDNHPWLEAEFLAEVAEGQYGLGRVDESAATLKMAVSRALAEPDGSMRTTSLSKVAATQAKLGSLAQALETAGQVADPKMQPWAWYGIVEAEAKTGRLDEAYRVAERIDGDAVPKTWMALAAAQAKGGHLPEARQALEKAEAGVKRITAAGYRIQMMLMLAESRAAVGDRSAAEDLLRQATALAEGAVIVEQGPFGILRQVEQVPGAVNRQFNLRAIASTQAKLGFTDTARRTFERAKVAARGEQPGLWQDSALTVVAESQAKAGMPDEAMQTLAELPKSNTKWLAYVPVARAKVRAGDLDGALRVADLHPGVADVTRSHIAHALLEAGDPKNALRVGLRATSPVEEVLHDAARQLAASGDVARVTDAVAHAYVEDRVALLLGAAEGLLDRGGDSAKGAAADPAKPAR
jgi:tetratricopeptide (TPR) repeat protein